MFRIVEGFLGFAEAYYMDEFIWFLLVRPSLHVVHKLKQKNKRHSKISQLYPTPLNRIKLLRNSASLKILLGSFSFVKYEVIFCALLVWKEGNCSKV